MATLGSLANQRYVLRERRLKLQEQIKELKEREEELEGRIFHALREAGVTSARGSKATVSIKREEVPTIEDFDAFFAYAKRKGNSDLLPKRVSTTAWRARMQEGKTVPGVKGFTRVSLQVTKTRS